MPLEWAETFCRTISVSSVSTLSTLPSWLSFLLRILHSLLFKLAFSFPCTILAYTQDYPPDFYYDYHLENTLMPSVERFYHYIPADLRNMIATHHYSRNQILNTFLVIGAISLYLAATSGTGSKKAKHEHRFEDRESYKEAIEKKRRKGISDVFYPGGLVNMGNTCFLNSVIQALVSLDYFNEYLERRTESYYNDDQLLCKNGEKPDLLVTDAMLALSDLLNDACRSRKTYRPKELLNSLAGSKGVRHLLGYQQQDAHELFQFLSSAITKEQEPNIPRRILSLKDVESVFRLSNSIVKAQCPSNQVAELEASLMKTCLQVIYAGRQVWIPRDLSRGSIRNPLVGLLASRISCQVCHYSSPWRHDTFDNLSLTVPRASYCQLHELLYNYTKPEEINGYICDKCTLIATIKTGQSHLLETLEKKKKITQQLNGLTSDTSIHSKTEEHENVTNHVPLDTRNESKKQKIGNKMKDTPPALAIEKDSKETARLKALLEKKVEELDMALSDITDELERLKRAKSDSIFELTYNDVVPRVKVESPLCTKETRIAYMPKSLCLHMQRSMITPMGYVVKNNTRVVFPELLDFNDLMGLPRETFHAVHATANPMVSLGDESPPPLEVSTNSPSTIPDNQSTRIKDGVAKNNAKEIIKDEEAKKLKPVLQAKKVEPVPRPFIYKLKSVVIHYGTHDSGHFVAYRKFKQPPIRLQVKNIKDKNSNTKTYRDLPAEDMWFRISDSSVERVQSFQEDVLDHAGQFAYMLFYERIESVDH